MTTNITSVAVEFGVELDKFKKQLEQAGDLSTQAQKESVKRWIQEEKKRTKAAETALKNREKAEKRALAEAAKAQKEATEATKRHNDQLVSQIPVVGELGAMFNSTAGASKMAKLQIAAVAGAVGALVAAMGAMTAGVRAFADIRAQSEETRVAIFNLNQSAALTSETLGAMQLAGGVDFLQKFGKAAGEFGKRISEAGRGTGALLPYLKQLDIQVRDSEGNMRTTNDVFREFTAKLQAIPPSADRSAAATQAFGRQGRELMAALGSTSLDTYVQLTEYFGSDVSSKAINNTREWNIQTTILEEAMRSTVDRLTAASLAAIGFNVEGSGLVELFAILNSKVISLAENLTRPTYWLGLLGDAFISLDSLMGGSLGLVQDIGEAFYLGSDSVRELTDQFYEFIDGQPKARTEAEITAEFMTAYKERLAAAREAAGELTEAQYTMFEQGSKDAKTKGKVIVETVKDMGEAMAGMMGGATFEPTVDTIGGWEFNALAGQVGDELEEAQARVDGFGVSMEDVAGKIAKIGDVSSSFLDGTSGLLEAIGERSAQRFGETSVRYRRTMRDLFAAQKAVAISNVIISTSQAIMQAFAQGGPAFGGIMTPIIAATSALQIANIAAEQPSFHTGGMIPSQTAAPDEVGITALSGEGVVSRRGMAALDAINRGDMMGGGSPVVVYGARVFDAVQGDLIQTPTSSISRAIRAKTRRRVGHRS
jgi:hypothetical protein